jgi:hypothetical protein
MREARRGNPTPHNARPGHQAPRSGWQGARPRNATQTHTRALATRSWSRANSRKGTPP